MTVRRHARNIVTQLPGVKGEAKNVKDPGDIWNLCFSDNAINMITKYTNQQIQRTSPQFGRETYCTPTDEIEIKAFLGMLLFAVVRRSIRLNAKDVFKTDGTSPEIFRLIMSWNRFYLLLWCLRFDDKDTRNANVSEDKLAFVRELFDGIISSFEKYYSSSHFVTVDEKLEAFRGRCSFR